MHTAGDARRSGCWRGRGVPHRIGVAEVFGLELLFALLALLHQREGFIHLLEGHRCNLEPSDGPIAHFRGENLKLKRSTCVNLHFNMAVFETLQNTDVLNFRDVPANLLERGLHALELTLHLHKRQMLY